MIAKNVLLSFASVAVMAMFLNDANAQILSPTSNSNSSAGALSGSASRSDSRSSSTAGAASNAGATSGSTATNAAGATTGASSVTFNSGNGSPVTNNTPSDVIVRSAPTIYAPNVVTGNVCALGASGGASWLGAGVAAGMSWESMQCERRQTAALLWNMGTPESKAAAKEIVCNSPEIRAAYAAVGAPCAVDMARVAQSTGPAGPMQPVQQQAPAPQRVAAPVQQGRLVCLNVMGREVPAGTPGASCGLI
jgi:hypothetical protein